jgi:predicted transglutaminase-like cysteine proteinase
MAPSAASADTTAGGSVKNAAVSSFNLYAAAVPEELSADIPAPGAYLAALKKDQPAIASSIMPAAGFAQPARHAVAQRNAARTGSATSGVLFGKAEKKYSDMTAFTNWSALFNRFSKPVETAGPHHIGAVEDWRKGIARFESLSDVEKINHVNTLVNQRPYIDDQKVFGNKGYWEATPVRFLSQGGDCKDYALTKYASLRALGFSDEQMRIAIVKDKIKSVSHAVLIVSLNGKNYVLDNQEKKVKLATEITRYKPIFSINRNNWWKQAS